MHEEIRSQAIAVEAARRVAARTKAELDATRQQWEEEHAELIARARAAANAEANAEAELRERAIEEYRATGDPKLIYGVGIRLLGCVQYEYRDAMQWAQEHRMFLRLDEKAFERFAKDAEDQLPFVRVVPVPTATIATDLGKALGMTEA